MPKGPLHGLCAALFLMGRMHQVVWGRTGWYDTGKLTRPTGVKAMAGISRKPWITPQDYLAAERTAEVRHEYVDGEIFAMVGASRRHATIVGNLFVALRQAARARGCQAYANDVKVRVEAANAFYYPDLVATCAGGDDDSYVVKDPVLVVEVLSDSTEAIDRREKRTNYQKIRSLRTGCTDLGFAKKMQPPAASGPSPLAGRDRPNANGVLPTRGLG
jgi:hypothetical protein